MMMMMMMVMMMLMMMMTKVDIGDSDRKKKIKEEKKNFFFDRPPERKWRLVVRIVYGPARLHVRPSLPVRIASDTRNPRGKPLQLY